MHRTRTHPAARRSALAAGLLTMLVTTPVAAQDHGHRHDMEGHLAELQEELDLRDSQVDRIRAIFTEEHAEMERLHAEQNGDPEAFRQFHDEVRERIEGILTEEQRDRLEQLHAKHGERHGGKADHRRDHR